LGRRRRLPAAARSHGSIYSGATPHFFLPEPGLSNKRIRSRLRAIYPYSLGFTGRNNSDFDLIAVVTVEGVEVRASVK
jgi:hypothetical protein